EQQQPEPERRPTHDTSLPANPLLYYRGPDAPVKGRALSATSLPAEDEVQRPATTDMGPFRPQVPEQFAVGAAGLLQRVGQHRQRCGVEVAGFRMSDEGRAAHREDVRPPPGRDEGGPSVRVAE